MTKVNREKVGASSVFVFPKQTSALTGDMETNGAFLIGTGTDFTDPNQLVEGDYILSADEIRKVETILGPTRAKLESSFSSNLSTTPFRRIGRGRALSVSVLAESGSPNFNGVTMQEGSVINIEQSLGQGLEPIIVVTGGGETADVTYTTNE